MGKTIKLRKSGKSLIMTFPKAICDIYGLKEGSEIELNVLTTTTLQINIRQ